MKMIKEIGLVCVVTFVMFALLACDDSASSCDSSIYADPLTVVKSFMTDERDGQTYKTVTIGTQTWMAENLNLETDYSYCYNDSAEYCDKYGRLYTWAAAMDSVGTWSTNGKGCGYGNVCSATYPVRGVCPEGWHLPSHEDWWILLRAVDPDGGYVGLTSGKALKSKTGWNDNGNGDDAFGFAALPAGHRGVRDGFHWIGESARFWSSSGGDTYAYYVYMSMDGDIADLDNLSPKFGYSVRCIKDSE
jgi:uncharacterized protein (TIGR02145 family)